MQIVFVTVLAYARASPLKFIFFGRVCFLLVLVLFACEVTSEALHRMATLNLRAVAAATFVPAFPLLLAEGIVSHHAVPAVGLVPLAFSSGFSLFTLLRMRLQHRRRRHSSGSSSSSSSSEDEDEEAACDSKHPIIYFVIDVVLAAALLIVLVFSWTKSDELSGKIAALAAYATIPLLINL